VFALPFALAAALVAAQGLPEGRTLLWILVAMVGARTAAMGFNRIVDLEFDRLNPRTANRELPTGKIPVPAAAALVIVASAVFVLSAHELNRLAFYLSFPTLTVLLGYSYTKRFTSWSHLVLGLCLGLAPMGAWVAIREEIAFTPLALTLAVLLWVAGFDILYSCMDVEFDKQSGLHSMVTRLGVPGALRVAAALHAGFLLLLAGFGALAHLGAPFYVVTGFIGALLLYEHALVKPTDLSRVNLAFFTVNGVVSLLILVVVGIEVMAL
jgi:4-hydroxybenzoate polyprenyltransferase